MVKKVQYRLIIFDLDDTLFDYKKTEIYSLKMACKDFDIPFINNETYSLYKEANNIAHAKYLELISLEDFNNFRIERAKIFLNFIGCQQKTNPTLFSTKQLEHSEKGVLIKGVYKTLKAIDKKTIKVVGTNGSNYPRKNKIINSKIKLYIDGFYSSEDLGVQKPDRKFFEHILNKYIILKKEVLVVGDNLKTDIQGALDLNINCCLFNYKREILPKDLHMKVKVIESFSELLKIIQ